MDTNALYICKTFGNMCWCKGRFKHRQEDVTLFAPKMRNFFLHLNVYLSDLLGPDFQ